MLKHSGKYLILLSIILAGCSPQSSNIISSGYHNMTARYNAYFIAKELMKEIETSIHDQYQWNYNKVLPIYPQFDSTDTASLKVQLDDCIEKASIAITRHGNSKWEDNCYILVGKARFYSLEFPDAIETFKYVNKHSEDDNSRHRALIELMRTFIEFKEYNNAIAVSDYLKKEDLNRNNRIALHLCRAYLYQNRKDHNQMVQNLVAAEELMTSSSERARIEFIIGQVYQQLGFEAEAYNFYKSVLKNNPAYELSFYTKLNMAQVTELTSSGDIKRIRKYFRKLLKDPKNLEYRDKIYYEMAAFELKQGNLDEAIDFYKLSVRSSIKNQRQKAYSYLRLGQIYYDSLKNFELAQAYYDSTVSTMPQDEEGFEKIRQRQLILDDFVKQIRTIRTNDSLLVLAELPKDSVAAFIRRNIEEQKRLEEERRRKEERRQANRVQTVFDQGDAGLIGTGIQPGAVWYFYNPSAISRGNSEFIRVWGNRPLEDNWRRSNKSGSQALAADSPDATAPDASVQQKEAGKEGDSDIDAQVSSMLATVPFDEEAKEKLLAEIETALFNLGNIYNFKLEENENAILTLEQLIARFPDTEYKPETLYQLYLLYKEIDESVSMDWASKLKSEFPDSIYAKLVDNPNYREESQAITEQLKKVYNSAYRMYEAELYKEARYLVDSALHIHPENNFSDNLKLLEILCVGMIEGQIKYQYELNNFVKTYSESELKPYAEKLVTASEEYQINLYSSSKARFVAHFNQKHYLVIVYPSKPELGQAVPGEVEQYLKSKNYGLTAGNLVLDKNHAMVLINEFPGKGTAMKFLDTISADLNLADMHKGEKFYYIVITEDNFDIFYQTKDLNAYLNFFEKHYQTK